MENALQQWHLFTEHKNPKYLTSLLADNVVFYSPVVHTPQEGKQLCSAYLMGAITILGHEDSGFQYVNEVRNESMAILEFTANIEGIEINGVDMIHVNEAGKIDSFKVMIRPLKAIQLIHQKMGEMLKKMQA